VVSIHSTISINNVIIPFFLISIFYYQPSFSVNLHRINRNFDLICLKSYFLKGRISGFIIS
jgi:hypothetical protein